MPRLLSACALVLVIGCTPIRPLDAPMDAAPDAQQTTMDAGADASTPIDAGVDAGMIADAGTDACYAALPDVCDGTDDDCDTSSADGSEDPMLGTACDGADSDQCNEGTYSSCVSGALVCDDATGDTIELCGGGDEDCDGTTDEDGAQGSRPFYPDLDRDGFGDDAGVRMACQRPDSTWETRGGDCDDTDANVRPGRPEVCNTRDDDCNGVIDDRTACGCDSATIGASTYLFCSTNESWMNARDACASHGYHLVIIDDATENTAVAMAASAAGLGGFQGAWIGLSGPSPTAFTWVDGSPLTYDAWDASEPNGTGDCVRMRVGLAAMGAWSDQDCGLSLDYICEFP